MASTRLDIEASLKLGKTRGKQAFLSMHPAFYYLKHDVEYDISMIERPRLRPVSEKQETITPENETILLFSFYFRHILPYAMLHKWRCAREWMFHTGKTVFR